MTFKQVIQFKCLGDYVHDVGLAINKVMVMIYINFVELLSLMLRVKFQNHGLSGSGEDF